MKNLPTTLTLVICLMAGVSPAWADDEHHPLVRAIIVEGDEKPDVSGFIEDHKQRGLDALQAGRYVEAARHLTLCVRFGADADDIKQALREAKQQVATVRIVLTEPFTTLKIDGKPYFLLEDLGPEVFLGPGLHRITASKPGFTTYDVMIDVKAGEQRDLVISLVQEGQGAIKKVLGVPTVVQMNFNTPAASQPERPTWPKTLMIGSGVGLGISAAMVLTGVILMDEQPSPWKGVAVGGAILGGISLTGFIVGLASKPDPPPPSIIVQPVVTNQQTGVSVSGQW